MCKYESKIAVWVPNFIELRHNRPENDVREAVELDVCMVEEIYGLWKLGIRTTGCCCGHGKTKGYIGVIEDDIERMKELGYEVQPNGTYDDGTIREDSFNLKG